ncbi:AAC(3) family N-acetyltransferase [Rhizobium herbae]|uniref:Aminoglycoside N(3)-acetyltransferase n=1 Tax=Rhizobium herbae TaxID=508661 RepID=A0ABS4EIK9_9HYPH|nr:AAC(3) family N-acetyltransferase [Rhizobium herbae]MBP1857789.1 aminoglycoside 3-N-acetyltransferase [Rhizobium herbae]
MTEFLTRQWKDAGLDENDVVLIHSSIKRTCALGYSPAQILQSFIDAVGPGGTVIFPLFNFDFCKGADFDIRETPSHMGTLTEAARAYPGAVRTGHPVYSFAVIGAAKDQFSTIANKSAYGKDSPFGKIIELNGKVAVLDMPGQNSMTFYHHVEEMCDVPYRYHKDFSGKYTGWDGSPDTRTFSIFVRDLEKGVLTDVEGMEKRLWEAGIYRGSRPKEGPGLRVARTSELFDAVRSVIASGQAEGVLFSYK